MKIKRKKTHHFTQSIPKILKNTEKRIILHNWTKNYDYRLYCSWDMVCIFHFGLFFLPFYPHNSLKTQNFKKMKKSLEILWFYTSVPKIMIICYTVLEIWCATDRRTDKRKKGQIEVCAPPKKRLSCENRNYFP